MQNQFAKPWLVTLTLVVLSGCSKNTPAERPSEKHVLSSMVRAVPPNNVPYGASHALMPRADLLRWLNKRSKRGGQSLPVKLPVVVRFTELRDVQRAFVGTSVADPGHDKLPLQLDDGRLGSSLKTRLRSKCGAKVKGCVLWMEGYWGPSAPGLSLHKSKPHDPSHPQPFSVRRPGALIQPGTPARASVAK